MFRPLHLVERLTEELGVTITYAYDDLVFIEHGAVLLRFDDDDSTSVNLYVSGDIHPDDAQKLVDEWLQVARMQEIKLVFAGKFTVEQTPGTSEIAVSFL